MTDVEIVVATEAVVLMHERCVHWPRTRTLLVADPHFGKAAAFRAAGVPVPRGTTEETLRRLDAALVRSNASRVVFLGDFLHAREGRSPETLRAWHEWRVRHAGIEMVLVRGNHDKRAGDPPAELDIRCENGPLVDAPFVFSHQPIESGDGYTLSGHIHPGARLRGGGRQSLRLPCFWFGERVAVLPAFGEFTGLADIDVKPGDRVFVVADDAVLPATMPSHA
ncbi:MAG: ligase-associated DNA damage response endonuclease PdeM [Gemmatimonadaceae bacterium]